MSSISFPEEEVALGLRVLALCGGNSNRAEKILTQDGHAIDSRTLRNWRESTHARRYLEVCNEIQSEIGTETAARAMELAGLATDAEEAAVLKTLEGLEDVKVEDSKDVANVGRAAHSMAQVKDISIRNAQLLREKPTARVAIENPAELIRELESLGVAKRSQAIDVEVLDPEGDHTTPPDREP